MTKKIEDKYKILTQIEHIIHRPGTYLGSNKPNTSISYIIEENKAIEKELTSVPSFIKIFDEVIVNAVDEHKRNPKLNKIDIIINQDKNFISITDNGGIPVEIHKEYNLYVPEIIFGNLMSGSNYDDTDERTVGGLNGLGAKLTNIFSKKFRVSTCDGKKSFLQEYRDNMMDRDKPIIKSARKKHTEIYYEPDLEKFGLESIDNDHLLLMSKRIYDLAGTNNGIVFTLNGEKISFNNFGEYISLYTEDIITEDSKDKLWSFGLSVSDTGGFKQVSFANGTDTYDGGTHVEYILNQIIPEIREYFNKKHKTDVKPSEIKNQLFLFLNATIINPSYSSQTKEKLITESKDFGFDFKLSKKTIQEILKSEVVNRISDWIIQKKQADDNKLARELNKKITRIKVDKLVDAKGKRRDKCSLYIFEGDSASGPIRKYRDPETQGSFSLRGKFINVSDTTIQKLVKNEEAINLMSALGLKIGQKVNPSELRYSKIIIATDADVDGDSITALLINFFYKYWSELFEMGMVYKLETPLLTATDKKKPKVKHLFYKQEDFNNWQLKNDINKWDIEYKKGLAALLDDEYKEIIGNSKLTQLTNDEMAEDNLNTWFGKETDKRKEKIIGN